jgi:tetratricopeptide (TPR) repeat protein
MLKQILQVAQEIESTFERSQAFAYVVQALAQTGQFERALTIAETIEYPYKKVDALASIARAYSKAGLQEKASEILEQALQVTQSNLKDPDNRLSVMEIHQLILGLITKTYVAIGQYSQAIQVAQNYSDRAQNESSSPIRDDWFLDPARRAELLELAKAENFQELTQTLRVTDNEITREHQATTLAEVACECAKAGQLQFAMQALQSAESIGFPKESLAGALKLQALSAIAVKYAEIGEYNLAIQTLEKIDAIGWRSSTLKKIGCYLAKTGQYDRAFKLIETIEGANEKNEALEELAKQYAGTGNYDKAFQIAKSIKGINYQDSAVLSIVEKYVESAQYEQAFEIAKRARRKDFKLDLLMAIAEASVQIKEESQVSEILSQLLQLSEEFKNSNAEKNSLLIKIVEHYIRIGQSGKASEILSQALLETKTIKSPGWKVFALTDIAIKYAELRQETKSFTLLAHAIKIVKSDEAILSKANTLSQIASALTEAGQCEQALQIIDRIEISDNFSWSRQGAAMSKCMALFAVAKKYAEINQKDKTAEILSKIFLVPYLDDSSKAGYIDTVTKIYFSIEDNSP